MDPGYNLVDEKWIPATGKGLLSLKEVFSLADIVSVGENPIQKVALIKFLLAVAHAAHTPKDESELRKLSPDLLAEKAKDYLDRTKDCFWLYHHERPFLQMPAIKGKIEEIWKKKKKKENEKQTLGVLSPCVSTGNTTVLTQSQTERPFDDSEKALLLLVSMGFALGGRGNQTDNSVVLTPGYTGKRNDKGNPATSKPGPFVGDKGFLHSFSCGSNLRETLLLNLFTEEEISALGVFSSGLGRPAWEAMPKGEDCEKAKELKNSYMGRLVPLSRFVLLSDGNDLHHSEGIPFPSYDEGGVDPSVSVDTSKPQKPKALWTDSSKRPWREIASLLSFLDAASPNGYCCHFLKVGVERVRRMDMESFSIWCGGLRVSGKAGKQYASGSDDFVESEISFGKDCLGETWLALFKDELARLEQIQKTVYASVKAYFKTLMVDDDGHSVDACSLFWQLVEPHHQELIDACEKKANGVDGDGLDGLRKMFHGFMHRAYEAHCPSDTARQLHAWAANRPRTSNDSKNAKTKK